MLRDLLKWKAVPLKYPQQETAISHRHAKTAVTSRLQGDTWKELLPVVWALPCFILSLLLSGFSQGTSYFGVLFNTPALFAGADPAALLQLHPPTLFDYHNLIHKVEKKGPIVILSEIWASPQNLSARTRFCYASPVYVSQPRRGERRFQNKQARPNEARTTQKAAVTAGHVWAHVLPRSWQVTGAWAAVCVCVWGGVMRDDYAWWWQVETAMLLSKVEVTSRDLSCFSTYNQAAVW